MNEFVLPLELTIGTSLPALFGDYLERYQAIVFRTAWRLTGSREDAEDVAQEVFLKLHHHMERLPEDSDVAKWLYRVTVNQSLDLRRRRRAMAGEAVLEGLGDGKQTALEQAEFSEQRERLARWIPRLAEGERAALVLRDLEGLSTREAAEILGVSEETVRTSVHRAKEKLRRWMS